MLLLRLRLRGGGKSKTRKTIGKPKKAKVVPATKDDVLARLSKVYTNNLQTNVGSLTRLMVKTYNEDKVAKGSEARFEFTDFGDDATCNMMRLHKPARKSTGGKAPRKQQKASATRLAEGGRAIELDADGLPWIAPRPRLAPPPESLPLKQKMVLRLRPGCEW